MTQLELARQEEKRLDDLGSLGLSEDLANDTIRIALNIAGYNPYSMNQFERASAILNMAQELAALTDTRKSDVSGEIWERVVTRSWEITLGGVA